MLNLVGSYASHWRYDINALKSSIMVLGESSKSRHCNRSSRYWTINGCIIPEIDEQHHLGIFHTVHPSTVSRTVDLFEGRKKVLQTALHLEVDHVVGQRKTGRKIGDVDE